MRVGFLLVGGVVGTLHGASVVATTLHVAPYVGILAPDVGLIVIVLLLLFARRDRIYSRLPMPIYRSRRLDIAWAKAILLIALVSALSLLLVLLVLVDYSMVLSLSLVEASAPASEIRNLSLLHAHDRTCIRHRNSPLLGRDSH